MKPKNKRISSGLKKTPLKRSIDMRGKWKAVELDPSLFSEEGLEGLVCFEELTNYRLVDSEKAAAKEPKKKKAKKRKAEDSGEAEEKQDSETKDGEVTSEPAKKKAKKKKKNKKVAPKKAIESDSSKEDATQEDKSASEEGEKNETSNEATKERGDVPEHTQPSKPTKKDKKKKKNLKQQTGAEKHPDLQISTEVEKFSQEKKTKKLKTRLKNWTNAALSASDDKSCDVSAWKDLFVPSPVLKALSSLGFSSPTPIQALVLPPAIRDQMDILGAAETGSGKTLAFGIPMIHTILEWKNGPEKSTDGDTEPASEVTSLYLPSANNPTSSEDQDVKDPEEEDREDVDETQEATDKDDIEDKELDEQRGCVKLIESAELDREEKLSDGQSRPLLGLVLTPTRELAVQVKHHIDAAAKFTDIKTAIVVGGMAQPKQRRMLNRRPEIVIATPGRLWDLINERHPHLLNLRQLKCLVIDEADRMVERGHFAQLENLLEMLKETHFNPKRQTFVFSATLTIAHSLPSRLQKKKNLDTRNKVDILMKKVGIKSKPKVIDLTRKGATVETLTETQIHCQKDEKDFYLYYFLLRYPGRTMVFANSIDCIKRLNCLLVILDHSPLPLHANMHQKQRLKNLERFAEKENCVLLTTDVAARGLDIPNVQHVIHYQVPRTSETYVHRSGRTARAAKEGLSLLLVGPDDMINFRKIYKTLGKDEELPMFPVESRCMEAIKERVNLARKIEKIEFYKGREKRHDSWFRQAAKALELDLDDDLLLGGPKDDDADREQQRMVKEMKKHLKQLTFQPIFKDVMKTKYPTKMGKIPLSHLSVAGTESALTRVLVQKEKQKLKKNLPPKLKKQKQKKVKQQQ
ncbi:ATP-dependent RNA helicase DDX24 [Kryptolebias marmoratus]|uniref:ATP-dependent RNA helicase n=1 Tax=Kryptolebias marmoratus TaxID=37003 RepID=A0A3Q2ZS30_KRYMA|nr:ATP-dependent RNA helicase DDX24 [Kryptolebias marmoratus]XP_037833791.1 ATP-dependent RNA helicase DDX24 [Kryptolebias marmoratus]